MTTEEMLKMESKLSQSIVDVLMKLVIQETPNIPENERIGLIGSILSTICSYTIICVANSVDEKNDTFKKFSRTLSYSLIEDIKQKTEKGISKILEEKEKCNHH